MISGAFLCLTFQMMYEVPRKDFLLWRIFSLLVFELSHRHQLESPRRWLENGAQSRDSAKERNFTVQAAHLQDYQCMGVCVLSWRPETRQATVLKWDSETQPLKSPPICVFYKWSWDTLGEGKWRAYSSNRAASVSSTRSLPCGGGGDALTLYILISNLFPGL